MEGIHVLTFTHIAHTLPLHTHLTIACCTAVLLLYAFVHLFHRVLLISARFCAARTPATSRAQRNLAYGA